MPQQFKRPSSSEPASRTTRSGGVGVASTTSARPSAVQMEIQCANSVHIGVCRADGVGNPVQVRHHLLINPAVSKDLAEARAPRDCEAEFVLAHVNEQLSHGTEAPSRQHILESLKGAVRALHAPTVSASVPAPAATATSPLHRRVAASASASKVLGRHGNMHSRVHDWRWVNPHWHTALTCNYPAWSTAPTDEEFDRVCALLLRLIATKASGSGPLAKEVARELLHLVLLRLQLLDPPALCLGDILEAPPECFWFTLDTGIPPPPLEALLDARLLEGRCWLEANELYAAAARAWLGATTTEVIKTLRATPTLPVSDSTRLLLQHDNQPVPSARAAQLVVLAGGPAAMRFLSSAIATAGIAQVLREADRTHALQAVVMNTAASEYFIFDKERGMVSLMVTDAHLRCNCARSECAWSLGKENYCNEKYIPTNTAIAAATATATTTTATTATTTAATATATDWFFIY